MNNKLSEWYTLSEKERIDILSDGVATDCSFIVGCGSNSEAVRCHQDICRQASTVFCSMFAENLGEDLTDIEIPLENVDPNTVHHFADFIYFENKEKLNKLSLQILKELVYLGEYYKINELAEICLTAIENFKGAVSLRDIANFYEYAHRVNNVKLIELFNRKKSEWGKNIKREQNDIYCSSIYEMSPACFMEFIKIFSSDNVKHCFEMIQYYIKKNFHANSFGGENKGEKLDKHEDEISKESDDGSKSQQDERGNTEDAPEKSENNLKNPENSENVPIDTKIDKKNNKFIINMMVNLIDFKRMTLVEFLNGSVNSDLLDVNTKLEILAEIVPKN